MANLDEDNIKQLSNKDINILEREWHRYESKVSDIILDGTTFELHIYENDPHIPHFYIIRKGFKCALCLYEPRYYGPYKDKLTDNQLHSLNYMLTNGNNDYLHWDNLISTYETANYFERNCLFTFKEDYNKSDKCPSYDLANAFNVRFEKDQQYVDLLKMYMPGINYYTSIVICKKIILDDEAFRIRLEFEPDACSCDHIRDDIFIVDNPNKKCSFMINEPKYYKYTQDILSDKQLEELTEILKKPLNDWFPEQSVYQQILDQFDIQKELECPNYKLANKEE
ncbi:MAG: hypothetical protein IKR19_08860 [Acholeplasmatales bacterium]|nr:hypothetical protein [Acholeplasmatales bacterium]